MIREILILVTIASHWGCGTQDYGEVDSPKAQAAAALGWKEAALKAKESPATLIPPQSGTEGSKDCPESTLCIRAAYLGAYQLRDLASKFPGHISTMESESEYRIMINNADNIQIESDIFEHEAGQLSLCGKTNTISTSIFQGSGELNSSGENCRRLNGGAISIVAYEITGDPKIITNGRNGSAGENGRAPIGEERAASGNPKSAKLSFDIKHVTGRWPLTKAAADGVGEQGADAALRNLRQLAQMGIYSEEILESHLNTNCAGCEKVTDRWYKSPNAGCFIYFQKDGLFDGASVKVENSAGLNGRDANPEKVWKGANGEDGGTGGALRLLSSKSSRMPRGELSSLGGKAGAGGIGAYQLPGLGADAQLESLFYRSAEKHWVGCLVKKSGKFIEVHDWKSPTSRNLDLHFSIGGPTNYDRLGGSSGRLNTPRGQDGKPIPSEILSGLNGAAGADGKSESPDLRFETDPDFLASFGDYCQSCSPLKILEGENNR